MSQIHLFDQPDPGLRDEQARKVIEHSLDQNIVVLAGAGAGKTHELVQRMVACVRSGRAQVQTMAAITFTRKAAGEMKTRFAKALAKASEQEDCDEAERGRLAAARERVDQCFVGTIHAFCARLLRERPVEAGLTPDFREMDERDEVAQKREAWVRVIEEMHTTDDPLLAGLRDAGLELRDLSDFFDTRYNYSDLPLKKTVRECPDLATAVMAAGEFVQEAATHIPKTVDGRPDAFMKMTYAFSAYAQNRRPSTAKEFFELLEIVDRGMPSSPITLKRWGPNADYARRLRDHGIPEFKKDVLDPAMKAWREFAYTKAAPIADKVLDEYRKYRRKNGWVTFQDLLEITAQTLRDRADVREYFQQRYRVMFVDEFQDTDPLQAELLMYLTAVETDERDWTRLTPRPGSLFIVGDEKQSIYRFRRADVETFRQVVAQIERAGGKTVHLTTSFRSLGNLCETFNRSFKEIFQNIGFTHQAEFARLEPFRDRGADSVCVREIRIPAEGGRAVADVVAQKEASVIARYIASAIVGRTPLNRSGDGGLLAPKSSPGDFMLIAHNRKRLSIYARELEAYRIPYDLTGGDSLGASEDLAVLDELVNVIVQPDNPVHFLAFLRGALVGLSDEELYEFKVAGGRFRYMSPLPQGLSSALQDKLDVAKGHLFFAEEQLVSRPVYAAFSAIVDRIGLLPYAAAQSNGSFRAGNLIRILSFIRQWEAEGLQWVQVVKELKDLMSDTVSTIEGMTLEIGQPDVVRIMNVHQAKGLQANVVFLVDSASGSGVRRLDPHVSRLGEQSFLSTPIIVGGFMRPRIVGQPEGWEQDHHEEELYGAEEEVRIAYVAATRARNLLVTCRFEGSNRSYWDDFTTALGNVPELVFEEVPPTVLPSAQTIPLEQLRRKRTKHIDLVNQPSYAWRTVTDLTKDGETGAVTVKDIDPVLAQSESVGRSELVEAEYGGRGRGKAYGSLVHKLLQELIEKRLPDDLEAYVRYLVAQSDVTPSDADQWICDALAAVDGFRQSSVADEVASARTVYTEAPFGLPLHREKDPVSVFGTIDLIYLTDGWHLVDYKTDTVRGTEDFALIVDRYAPQLQAYARAWTETSGEPVLSASIWSTQANQLIPVRITVPDASEELE